jgi:hypothetical protein
MPSYKNDPVIARTTEPSGTENYNGGIYGESTLFNGVRGVSYAAGQGGTVGINEYVGDGAGPGVYGESKSGQGVAGVSHSANGAVVGINDWAPADPGAGGNGGWFESVQGEGVRGTSKNPNHGGVVGINTGGGTAVYGKGQTAGFFEGDVEVTGDIRLTNADCAEDFDVAGTETIEPGTVMVLSEEGVLQPSDRPYDRRVAGIVSGAGGYKPGIVLDKQPAGRNRSPIALLGKVFCKVDAAAAPVEVGDLLTTSETPGHAMKAGDPAKAFGAVIGKALRPLVQGRGLVPVLIALQ